MLGALIPRCFHWFLILHCFMLLAEARATIPPEDAGVRARHPGQPILTQVRQQVNKAKGEQEKWKGTVQEQRRNVYDRHNMLN